MHLVGFTVEIYYDAARSYKCQTQNMFKTELPRALDVYLPK